MSPAPIPSDNDPLAGVREDAERAVQEAETRLRAIENAPSDHAPPPIPAMLEKPVQRRSNETSTTAKLSGSVSDLGKSLAIGLDFLWMLAAGAFIGWLADRWLGKGHVGILIGLGLGFLVGTWRLLRRLNAAESAERKGRAGGR